MRGTTTLVVVTLLSSGAPLCAQTAPDTVRSILALHDLVRQFGPTIGPRVWPGFRPDTIPTVYVIPGRAKLFVQWRGPLPRGFVALPGVADAGWADTQIVSFPSGRFIAFMATDSDQSVALVLGTTIHEEFHSFERSVLREGARFGGGENAMLVGTYPVFDIENEAAFALEGRVLRQALGAGSDSAAGGLARRFLAIRDHRQGRLDSSLVNFEQMAEMNEGLAQYALLRGLAEIGRLEGEPWISRAGAEAANEAGLLDSLLSIGRRSIRRRFYATGSAIALLLDRLSDSTWKTRLMDENLTLQGMLGLVTGYRGRAEFGSEGDEWMRREEARLRPEAVRSVAQLKARRAAQADSILAQTGVRLILDPSSLRGKRFQWCGFDPQNTLQVGDGRTLHMRFLRVCADSSFTAEFDHPVVENAAGELETVANPVGLKMTAQEQPISPSEGKSLGLSNFRIDGPGVTLEAHTATVTRKGRELRVVLHD